VEYPLRELIHLTLIPELGPSRIRRIIGAFNTPEALKRATVTELCRVDGFDKVMAASIRSGLRDERLLQKAEKQVTKLDQHGARVFTFWDEDYPANLRAVYNPPALLYVKGSLVPEDVRSVAIVGTRTVSDYGRVAADKLARDLAARGITIVSGMATGIDSCAHWGAVKAGGRTIAVLGCGVDIVYPAENNTLYRQIIENGAVLSEFPFGTKPTRGGFPARNRIISGLTLGTVIVEAGKKSGSLITAEAALEQNREVFAVPGNINSRYCQGTNRLIKEGAAKLIQSAGDIIDEIEPKLNRMPAGSGDEPPVNLSDEESRIYELIGHDPVLGDNLVTGSGLSAAQVSAPLLTLELKGLIRRLSGNKFVRI